MGILLLTHKLTPVSILESKFGYKGAHESMGNFPYFIFLSKYKLRDILIWHPWDFSITSDISELYWTAILARESEWNMTAKQMEIPSRKEINAKRMFLDIWDSWKMDFPQIAISIFWNLMSDSSNCWCVPNYLIVFSIESELLVASSFMWYKLYF